ncbi:MAG: NFACT family protein [Acidobacteria bacterium]|nr:NFACT family protein [Acidobacteriota bacterium]
MALENYLLEKLTDEAIPLITNQIVGKIQQPGALDFIIGLRRSDNLSIYFSLLPSRPTFFLTNKFAKNNSNEESPNHLTNFMRKYLTGATLIELVKEPYERRLIINFSSFDVIGKAIKLNLLLDLMGRSANAHIFVDRVLLASLRELPEDSPSVSLSPLPQQKLLQNITKDSLNKLLEENKLVDIAKQLPGFSPTLVRELLAKTEKMPPYQALQALESQLKLENHPQIYAPEKLNKLKVGTLDLKNNLILTYINLEIGKDLIATEFSSLNKATETYFSLLQSLESFQTRRNSFRAKIKAEITKLESLVAKLKIEQKEFLEADKYRSFGELILANLGVLHIEANEIFLIDYFSPEQREISLKIADNQTPKQLAEDYFKRYQRAKRGQQAIEKRLISIEKELAAKYILLSNILSVLTEEELDLLEKPFIAPKVKVAKKTNSSSKEDSLLSGMRRYVSSDGYEILVGRSDKGNEQLTFQLAKAQDIWLHTADYPGSHVVIRNPQKLPIPQRTIYEAAQLAAYFSKAREETNAAVRYTERKNVSRPKKAKIGMALLTDFKTIMVNPQESGSRLV